MRQQILVANDIDLARALDRSGELQEFSKDEFLIRQGDADNDLLLIVHGEVSILVNDRAIATRSAGTHLGELALVDSLANRSASAQALRHTVVLRVPEHKFSGIAEESPELWRRIAVEIAKRLKERNRFLRQPRAKPVIFIGSSSEGRDIADAIHNFMTGHDVVPRMWSEGVFEPSGTTIESLTTMTDEADFAALVCTADDITESRGVAAPSPRDNVVFELGLFMGALERKRVFMLNPKNVNVRIPTDLLGVTRLEYRRGGPGSLREKLRTACVTMLRRIETLGPR